MRRALPLLPWLVAGLLVSTPWVLPFHEDGVASCDGCHVMHVTPGEPHPGDSLLRGGESTDACLRCHETTNGNTWGFDLLSPGPLYGGGSFIFLLEENLNDGPEPDWIPGDAAGHNVISLAFGVGADSLHATSPGGSYPSSALSCTSCHDPHGGGNFRMLYGGSNGDSRSKGHVFQFGAVVFDATGIPLSGPQESNTNHAAYRSGVSEWCANCHGRYHESAVSGFEHPVDHPFEGEIARNYNAYEGTGFYDTGDGTDAYITLVPYEDPLSPGPGDTGPASAGSRLTCLSCHRAHASSGPHAGRWDFTIETWADEGLRSGSFPIPNPYAGTAGSSQRELCEKCHGETLPD